MGKEQANIPGKKRKALVIVVWEAPKGEENLVLLLKRPQNEAGYLWQPVTGNLDAGEDFAAGAQREAEEETGLRFLGPPRFLGIEHKYDGRWGPAEERGFRLAVGGKTPPTPILDPKEHDAFEWLPAAEAIRRVPFAQQQEAILRAALRPTPLVLTREGTFTQDGETITHERTALFLHQHLVRAQRIEESPREGFVVRSGQEELPVEVEDAPFFVSEVDLEGEKIRLLGREWTKLDPTTLVVGPDNALYCMVDGELTKFLRGAYYEIVRRIEDAPGGGYEIEWAGKRSRILPLT